MTDKSKFYVKEFSVNLDRLDYTFYNPDYETFLNLKKISKHNVYEVGDENILTFIRSGSTPKIIPQETEPDGGKVLFLKNENIKEGTLHLENKYYVFRKDYEGKLRQTQVKKGDILFSMTGTLGNACLIRDDIEATINQNLVIMRFNNELVDSEYIMRYLNSYLIKKQIQFMYTSAQTPYLNISKIKSLKLIIPQIDIQRDIVAKIQQNEKLSFTVQGILQKKKQKFDNLILNQLNIEPILTKKYDYFSVDFKEIGHRLDFIQNNPRYKELLVKLNKYKLSDKFDNYINDIGNGIEIREFVQEGTLYLRVGDIHDGKIVISDSTAKIKTKLEDVKKDILLTDNDIILTRSGRVGSAAYVTPESKKTIISSDLIKVNLTEKIIPKFIVYYLNSSLGQMQFEMIVHGAASPKINQENISSLIIAVPTIKEQNELVFMVDKEVDAMDDLKEEAINLQLKSNKILIESISNYGTS